MKETAITMTGKKRNRPPRTVVSVNPDGTVDCIFDSAEQASVKHGCNRATINRYCKQGLIGLGRKWFYEDDFRQIYMNCELERLRFTLPDDYVHGRSYFRKGHTHGNGWERKSEESRQRQREQAREQAGRLNRSGANCKGAFKTWKPVVCLTDGTEYPSIRHAADHYGIPQNKIVQAIHRVGTTCGLKFRLKSQLESVKEAI